MLTSPALNISAGGPIKMKRAITTSWKWIPTLTPGRVLIPGRVPTPGLALTPGRGRTPGLALILGRGRTPGLGPTPGLAVLTWIQRQPASISGYHKNSYNPKKIHHSTFNPKGFVLLGLFFNEAVCNLGVKVIKALSGA